MNCSICLGNPQQPQTLQCCKNTYCKRCISQWNQVRNVCPLCMSLTGDTKQQVNCLIKGGEGQQNLDDGFIMLQNQLKQVLSAITSIKSRIQTKRQQHTNLKSLTSSSYIQHLQEQLLKIAIYEPIMQEQFLLHNRANTVQNMQIIMEILMDVELCLESNAVADDYADYYDQDQYLQEYIEDNYDDYMEEDYYQRQIYKNNSFKNKKNKVQAGADGGLVGKKKPINLN